ncbi:D-alanyl-D-alanine carboxypeptidase [Acaryochloris sp. CCMEE 5410]|uniref:D-alanyl-D-alanine carboxypeptidase n=1 Tax=Acaryochloris sp. CCMEE 5410 TaxID=310037 RepID=UPI0002484AE7|nr:D-alanyl-D-alanine carboxypeptidase [Acaryochloris sp. CCMEE 5410]KAI9134814.1 D-alanyl-D-alanine carboxypeptidase [Acaryochloris sp. CCMEE 5410]
MICSPRLARIFIALSLIISGCSNSDIQPSSSPSPEPTSSVPEPPPPLQLGLADPATVANPQIEAYLSQLGAPTVSQGVWIQTQDTLLANHQGTMPLPAASITKVATSLAVLKKLGPDHRFETKIGYIGTLQNGELNGDLVIEGGADPFFVWEDAIALGNLLNQNGIRNVSGNLIVVGPFYMNYEPDPVTSGTLLQQGLDHTRWPAEAQTQYQTLPGDTAKPEVAIAGSIQPTTTPPTQVKPLIQHRSLPVAELLKKMNQYSNNTMSEMLAEYVGGAAQVAQIAAQEAGVPTQEIQLINGSGLGVDNRISPRATCGMFQAIARLLHPQKMTIADIFAVIGTDPGVHNERSLPQKFVMKSGTLNRVSSIAGALPTENQGVVWFAVINGEGDVDQFRAQQETLLQTLMQSWGTTTKTFDLITANPSRQSLTAISQIVPSN